MKRLILGLLCAISIVVCPVYAESNLVHKAARVVWYAAQVGAGCFCLDRFHTIAMRSLSPCSILDACLHNKKTAGSYGVASVALLSHGLSGLDTEFRILEGLKRRVRKLQKK